jgi:hypothetical protein
MVSAALASWSSSRAGRLDNLLGAHVVIAGSAPGRGWATEELNHALVLRLASEFQGFCRDLHNEAVEGLVRSVAPTDVGLQRVLAFPYLATRKLDRGNAEPGGLGHDFGLLGMRLWPELRTRYPVRGEDWRSRLAYLNEARNGIAHDDASKVESVRAAGWPLTVRSIRRWRQGLDGLATGMDHVVREYLWREVNVTRW